MSSLVLLFALLLNNYLILGSGNHPEVAQTDAGALVAWRDNSLKLSLAGSNVTTTLLAQAPLAHAIATHGPESLAVWADGAKLTAVRLDGRGIPIGDSFTIANTTAAEVAPAADGERYVVVWPGTFGDVWALILSRDGNILLPPSPVTTQSTDAVTSVHVAANGERFLISWTSGRRVLAQRVDNSGVAQTFLPTILTNTGGPSDVASNGRDFFVVWHRAPNGVGLGATAITNNGVIGDELRLTAGTDGEPRVTWDGWAYAVAYNTLVRFGSREVPLLIVARFGANGYPLETTSSGGVGEKAIAARNGRIALAQLEANQVAVSFADASAVTARRRAIR